MKRTIMAIDGNSLLHRAFYAIPILSNREGVFTNAVYGFLNMFLKILQDYNPYSVAVAFDKETPTFRHLVYKEYKGTRQKAPEELLPQFDLTRKVLTAMNIPIYEADGYEADDILGTISYVCGNSGQKVVLVTGDRDALQLVSKNTEVLMTKKGISVIDTYDLNAIVQEYGLTPDQLIDMKGLMGDNSDNIPGVPGIGPKTAIKLLKEYNTLENILSNVDNIKSKKIKENLIIYRQHALLSRDLATIRCDAPIDCSLLTKPVKIANTPLLKQMLAELELHTILDRLGFSQLNTLEKEKSNERNKTIIEIQHMNDLRMMMKELMTQKEAAFLFHFDEISIAWTADKVYRIRLKDNLIGEGLKQEEVCEALRPFIENKNIYKVGNDSKQLLHWLDKLAMKLEGLAFDTKIGAYLLDPNRNKYELEQLLYDYADIDVQKADAADLLSLSRIIKNNLKSKGMDELYNKVEHPIIRVLYDMEKEGFRVDKNMLQQLDMEFTKEAENLSKAIIDLAGEPFNINSPKQLGEILFDKLGLPVQKRTKTGYSTDIEVLEKLQGMHPIIELIMDYRQVMKLKTTYIDGLLPLINVKDGKIHSSFHQTVAATGRISSSDPNLQNIPVKMEIGRRIRKVFTASDKNHVLVDADYSQIELRVLAHISEDPSLIESFQMNEDIHRRTASEIFDIPLEKVDDEQRNKAKAVNFGIIYGISDFGLAKSLGISRAEAKKYIENYLHRFPLVARYMSRIIKEGKEKGYVTTLFNRRRDIPELASRNYNTRSFGERIALNTPIQGTAADIIKIAMIKVHRELERKNLLSKLILQVHDELIVDACKTELEEVYVLLKEQMENAVELSVPLVVDIKVGENWYDVK
jgi:DNA polymerase-1